MHFYQEVAETSRKRFKSGRGLPVGNVPLPAAIEHAQKIVDYLWNSEMADSQLWTHPSTRRVYNSVLQLQRWIDQQASMPIRDRITEWTFFGLRWDRANLFAFTGGFLSAVLFFLPEIVVYWT